MRFVRCYERLDFRKIHAEGEDVLNYLAAAIAVGIVDFYHVSFQFFLATVFGSLLFCRKIERVHVSPSPDAARIRNAVILDVCPDKELLKA